MFKNKNVDPHIVSFENVCQSAADVLDKYVCNIKYFCEDNDFFFLTANSDKLFEFNDSEDPDDEVSYPLFLRVHKRKNQFGDYKIEGSMNKPNVELTWEWYSDC